MVPLALLCFLFPTVVVLALPNAHPMITPAPAALEQRDLESVASSYGVQQFLGDLPFGEAVEKMLGISDRDLDARPAQVLNLPAYGNWTEEGWNVYVHGNVYKIPDICESRLNDLADLFLIDVSTEELPPDSQAQARNMTASIFVVQQEDVNVTIAFTNDVDTSGEKGAVNAAGGSQELRVQDPTTQQGDFGGWLKLVNTTGQNGGHLVAGNQTDEIQTLNMHAKGTDSGNATAYLVPPTGITVISDIDDILRVTKIWSPKEGLLNSFAHPFTPWLDMPEIYANWAQTVPNLHFHYLTTTPEQVTRNYMEFAFANYPLGSFDTRPLNFSDVSATLSIREHLLDRIFATFPERKFILVGDTSNSDVMRAYPQLAKDFPEQVQCIWLRNTSATDATFKFPYDTKGFEGLEQNRFMFFRVPDDLTGLDVAKGECYNQTVSQNVTFGMQGELSGESGAIAVRTSTWVVLLVVFGTALAMS